MMKRIFCLALPATALLFCGCEGIDFALNAETIRGSGRVISEKRDVHGFKRVELAGSGELSISQGSAESLTIEADDNIVPKIKTEVWGDRLKIGMESGVSVRPTVPMRYTLVVRDLTELELSGSGKINAGSLRCGDLTLDISGSGSMRLDQLTAENVRAEIDGSGNIRVVGKATGQTVQISGSGSYHAEELESSSARVSIDGSGDSTIWVHNALSASIGGSGSVEYYGNPNSISRSVSGSGRVRSLGDRPYTPSAISLQPLREGTSRISILSKRLR